VPFTFGCRRLRCLAREFPKVERKGHAFIALEKF
jgi:hypothetical protein